jgi:hypothetical protein
MLQNYPKPLKIQGEVGVLMLLFEKERSFYRALNNQLSLFLLENDELNVNYFSLKNTSKYQLPGMILNGENKCIEKILNYNYVKNHNIHKINYFLERSQLSLIDYFFGLLDEIFVEYPDYQKIIPEKSNFNILKYNDAKWHQYRVKHPYKFYIYCKFLELKRFYKQFAKSKNTWIFISWDSGL